MSTSKGFTLIEVLVAAFLVTLGAGGAFALIQKVTSFTTNASSQLEASYLAQEGIEIVRNIRDTNFLKIHKGVGGAWTDGLTACESGCGAGYRQENLFPGLADTFLNIGSGGFYTYAAGTQSPYKRKIIVVESEPTQLHVSVEVTWEERGRSHKVEAATKLFNWLELPPEE